MTRYYHRVRWWSSWAVFHRPCESGWTSWRTCRKEMAKESSGLYHWTIITRILKFTLSCTTPPHPHFLRPQRKKNQILSGSKQTFKTWLLPVSAASLFSAFNGPPTSPLGTTVLPKHNLFWSTSLCKPFYATEHPDLPVPSLIRLLLTCRFNPAASPEES